MRPAVDRILTTHAGSLPRPEAFLATINAHEAGSYGDEAAFAGEVQSAVAETVRRELDAGVDVLNDGEVSKPSYATYVKDRLTGMSGDASATDVGSEVSTLDEFPDFREAAYAEALTQIRIPACDGPLSYVGHAELQADIDNLKGAVAGADPAALFMSSASPGTVAIWSPNQYYSTEEEYLWALGDAMQVEYEAIVEAGILLQLDCPDFAWAQATAGESLDEFRRKLALRIEVLNHAVRNIPAEAMRVHVCWGNGEWPRTHDIGLEDIIETIYTAKPAGIMVMAANGRHAHEWLAFEDAKLPDGKYVLPGVIDTASNVVEHPETVAQRLLQYAKVVGRENVVAATDCGFAQSAGVKVVAPTVAWAKLRAMADGAKLASDRLWS